MAIIEIQKRVRVTATDNWGAWETTTDVPPYSNTDLVEYKVIDSSDIQLEELTNGSLDSNNDWTGTGVFDVLMKAVNDNIGAQRSKGRITGEKYGDVYLGSIQSVINSSMNFLLQEKGANKELDVKQAQEELYIRQKEGFDDNKYQKLFESQMSSWALMFSSGLLTEKPSVITSDKASALYTKLTEDLSL